MEVQVGNDRNVYTIPVWKSKNGWTCSGAITSACPAKILGLKEYLPAKQNMGHRSLIHCLRYGTFTGTFCRRYTPENRKTINYKPPIVLELLGAMLALGRVAESKTTFIELKELRSFSGRQKFIKKNLDAWLPLRLQALNLLGFCLAVQNEQPVSQSAYFFSAAAVQEYNCQSICKWGSPKEGLYKLPFHQMLPGDIVRQNVTSLSFAGHDIAWYSPLEGLLL